jgi:hypothetical protein
LKQAVEVEIIGYAQAAWAVGGHILHLAESKRAFDGSEG